MILVLSILLALLPSLAWLALFLREDVHPEPNRLVVRAFFAGALSVLLALPIELAALCVIPGCPPGKIGIFESLLPGIPPGVVIAIHFFLGVALVEELMKFLFVKRLVLGSADFDEPVDALLYLVIGALGFAAVENILVVTNQGVQTIGLLGSGGVFMLLGARFLSATLLHTLASGIIGYTVARALFQKTTHRWGILWGIFLATVVHGVYNELIQLIATNDRNPLLWLSLLLGLMLVTSVALWLMLQKLRADSRVHAWRHNGKLFTQIV